MGVVEGGERQAGRLGWDLGAGPPIPLLAGPLFPGGLTTAASFSAGPRARAETTMGRRKPSHSSCQLMVPPGRSSRGHLCFCPEISGSLEEQGRVGGALPPVLFTV